MNLWGYFRCSSVAKSTVVVQSVADIKNDFIPNIMFVLITCKFKTYQMNSNQETGFNACSYYLKVSKRLDRKQQRKGGNTISALLDYGRNFRHSSANYSILCGTIWSKFELLIDIMHVIDTYKFKMDWINTKREKNGSINFSDAKGQLLCGPWSDLAEFQTHPSIKCMSSFKGSHQEQP